MPFYIGPQKWWLDQHNTDIVTNGLVLNLDAGDSSSYPGTGTTWYDLSGNGNNGTLVGGVGYNRANGGSLIFQDNYVSLPDAFAFSDNPFTIECWVNGDTWGQVVNGNNFIYASQDSNLVGFYGLGYSHMGTTNIEGFFIADLYGNGRNISVFNTTPDPNKWYHIVALRTEGNEFIVYVNTEPSTNNQFSNLNLTSQQPVIGTNPASPENFYGKISVFRMYNRALTQGEIIKNYNALKVRYEPIVTDSLVLHLDAGNPSSYPGSGTTWYDLSGNGNNGILVNGVSYDSANSGSLVFDGSTGYVLTNYTQTAVEKYTISVWFKGLTSGDNILVSNRGVNESSGQSITLFVNFLIWPGSHIALDGNGIFVGSGNNVEGSSSSLDDGNWHNLVGVLDGQNGMVLSASNFNLYLDGILLNTTFDAFSGNAYPPFTGLEGTVIGSHVPGLGAGFYQGNISNVLIYTKALTQQEVTQNYNALKGRYAL